MNLMIKNILLVAAGGATGSVLRYLCTLLFNLMPIPSQISTFTVNAVGSLLIGMLSASLQAQSWSLFLIMGLCGGFTTYSTYSMQTVSLFQQGDVWQALLYAIGTMVVCLLFTYIGWKIPNF